MDALSYWKVGKFINENTFSCENIHKSCSKFLSYYFGNSHCFSLFHIQMMEKMYQYFPIYLDCMRKIQWNSYLELLNLNKEECYFYYQVLLFCGDDSMELRRMIQNDLYFRIKKAGN